MWAPRPLWLSLQTGSKGSLVLCGIPRLAHGQCWEVICSCIRKGSPDVPPVLFQAMVSVTAENASAMRVTLGTIVTAQQTSARAGPRTGRSVATVGTASVGNASAQSPEPLGRHVRSVQPAQTLAAPRGNSPSHCAQPCQSSSQAALRASQLHSPQPAKLFLIVTEIVALKCWFHGYIVRKRRRRRKKKNPQKQNCYSVPKQV